MIIKYKPQYKKAILDLAKKNTEYWPLVEQNLKHDKRISFVYLGEDRKFKGFICGSELIGNSAMIIYIATKYHKMGPCIGLYRHFREYCKEHDLNKLCYYRENSGEYKMEVL